MSDFDNEKTGGQERPDYYQPNQNEGQHITTLLKMSRLTITQPITIPTQVKHRKIKKAIQTHQIIQAVTATIINRRKMIISKTQKTAIRQSRLRRNPVPAK